MKLQLNDIADTSKDMQKPCSEQGISTIQGKINQLERGVIEIRNLSGMKRKMNEIKSLDDTNTKHHEVSRTYQDLKQSVSKRVKTGCATYIRWGRKTYAGNGSDLIYSLYAGGSWYDHLTR